MFVFPASRVVAAPAGGPYTVARSLRFSSPSSLSRAFGTPTGAAWALSMWIKRAGLGTPQALFSMDNTGSESLRFAADDKLYLYKGGTVIMASTGVYRDTTGWLHLFMNHTGGTGFFTIVVNNNTAAAISGLYVTEINTARTHYIGVGGNYPELYLAEVQFVDGQALTQDSFGAADPATGLWSPKQYAGSYGANGFKLTFADNSGATAATLGKDTSGNNNNWTPDALTVTAGVNNDSFVDTPTGYGTDTGAGGEVRGNYCTMNEADRGPFAALANGNLAVKNTNAGVWSAVRGTIGVSSGKWYYEAVVNNVPHLVIGWGSSDGYLFTDYTDRFGYWVMYAPAGHLYGPDRSGFAYGSEMIGGETIGVALDLDAGTMTWHINGVSQGAAFAGTGLAGRFFPWAATLTGSGVEARWDLNFGQRPFTYTAPAGHKVLCTHNLPAPPIALPGNYFAAKIYTGTGAAQSLVTGLQPDLVWMKGRGATDHATYDSARGVQKDLAPNLEAGETTQAQGLTAFNVDGFSVGTLAKLNNSSSNYADWAWKKGAPQGVDVVSVASASSAAVSHALGVKPELIITKSRNNPVVTTRDTSIIDIGPNGGATGQYYGLPGVITKTMQSFISVGTKVVSVKARFSTSNYPPDSVQAQIYTADANHKPATLLYSADNPGPGSSFPANTSDYAEWTFTFTNANVAAGTEYCVVFSRTGSNSYSHYYIISLNAVAPLYPEGIGANTSGGAWTQYSDVNADIQLVITQEAAPPPVITRDWWSAHKSLGSAMQDSFIRLNKADAAGGTAGIWGGEPTNTAFYVANAIQPTGDSYIAYLFASVPGFSSIGAYTGNGNASGPFVWTGFRPRWLMLKRANTAGDWIVKDAARNPSNPLTNDLFPNLANAEATAGATEIDFLSSGFKIRNTTATTNVAGASYIYAAFAEAPFNYARAR